MFSSALVTRNWNSVKFSIPFHNSLLADVHSKKGQSSFLRLQCCVCVCVCVGVYSSDYIYIYIITAVLQGHAVAQLVEALRYKLEGRRFDSRWCNWNFSLT